MSTHNQSDYCTFSFHSFFSLSLKKQIGSFFITILNDIHYIYVEKCFQFIYHGLIVDVPKPAILTLVGILLRAAINTASCYAHKNEKKTPHKVYFKGQNQTNWIAVCGNRLYLKKKYNAAVLLQDLMPQDFISPLMTSVFNIF